MVTFFLPVSTYDYCIFLYSAGNIGRDVTMRTVELVIWIGIDCGDMRPGELPNDNSVRDITEQVKLELDYPQKPICL